MKTVNLSAEIKNTSQTLQAQLSSITHSLNAEIASGIIYAISPTAKVEELPNGNYLITITDKNGTTTAEINNINQDTINNFISLYFENNPIIQDAIQRHNVSAEAHADIRELIERAINFDDILILDCGNASTEY